MDLSVILPLYNEEENLQPMYDAITQALAPLELNYEILFIDDGSRDRTFAQAAELAHADARLRVIKFRRNYGQTPAMVAGIEHAKGDILLTMDGDLQNDPRDIPIFLDKLRQGYDIVVGWRYNRQDKLITRKIPSKIANWLIGKITGVPIKDNGCSLKAYRARVIQNIPLYSEMHRFIPAMTSLAGTRIAEVKVNHHARRFGKSKYGLSRIYKVLLDLLVIKTLLTFFARPIISFAAVALFAGLISSGALIAALIETLAGENQPSTIFFGLGLLYATLAITVFFWGILAEVIYRTGDLRPEIMADLVTDKQDTEVQQAR
ncbi:MAG: glycosyltransferase family 2 protein [Gammaproteobacteria bacterium]